MGQQQQQFEEILQKVKNDPYAAITVFDTERFKNLGVNKDNDFFVQNYGSIEDFFNKKFSEGSKKITIRVKRKNGSAYKDDPKYPDVFSFDFNEKTEQLEEQAQNFTQNNTTAPAQKQYPQSALAGSTALSIPEYTNLMLDSREKVRLENELKELKVKYDVVKKENKKYRESELKNEAELKAKETTANTNKGYLEMIMPHMGDKLGQVMVNLTAPKNQVVATALGNPEGASEIKTEMYRITNEESDATINYLLNIHSLINKPGFIEELNVLIQKYQADGN